MYDIVIMFLKLQLLVHLPINQLSVLVTLVISVVLYICHISDAVTSMLLINAEDVCLHSATSRHRTCANLC